MCFVCLSKNVTLSARCRSRLQAIGDHPKVSTIVTNSGSRAPTLTRSESRATWSNTLPSSSILETIKVAALTLSNEGTGSREAMMSITLFKAFLAVSVRGSSAVVQTSSEFKEGVAEIGRSPLKCRKKRTIVASREGTPEII